MNAQKKIMSKEKSKFCINIEKKLLNLLGVAELKKKLFYKCIL